MLTRDRSALPPETAEAPSGASSGLLSHWHLGESIEERQYCMSCAISCDGKIPRVVGGLLVEVYVAYLIAVVLA